MPLQNRVLPTGEVVATTARGTMMGNRGGAIHGPDKRLGARRWASKQWICCVLQFRGRQREVMTPDRYTELFFLDEVTALAAGHRPCFECRRSDAVAFAQAWGRAFGLERPPRAGEMDAILHADRLDWRGDQLRYAAVLDALPDGAFYREGSTGETLMVWRHEAWTWTPWGYRARRALSRSPVEVLTPRCIIATLKAGYKPLVHETAGETV